MHRIYSYQLYKIGISSPLFLLQLDIINNDVLFRMQAHYSTEYTQPAPSRRNLSLAAAAAEETGTCDGIATQFLGAPAQKI